MANWLDEIGDDAHQMTVRQTYPLVIWLNAMVSNPKAGFAGTGGFFFDKERLPANFSLPNQEIETVDFAGGGTGQGYTFVGLHLVPLANRLDWFWRDPQTKSKKRFMESYNAARNAAIRFFGETAIGGKVAGRNNYLCLVKEFAPWYGPVIFTASGRIGQMIQKDCVEAFLTNVLGKAQVMSGKNLPPYAFWIPIKSSLRRELSGGEGTGLITPPMLALPAFPTADDFKNWLTQNYVGKEVLEIARTAWDTAQEWAKAPLSGTFGEPQNEDALTPEEESGVAPSGTPEAGFPSPDQAPPGLTNGDASQEGAFKGFRAWSAVADRLGWPDQRRTGHLQKWYIKTPEPDLTRSVSSAWLGLKMDEVSDALAEMDMRKDLLNLGVEVQSVNALSDPAKVAEEWVKTNESFEATR